MLSHRLNIQGRKGMLIKNNANKKEFLDEIKEKKKQLKNESQGARGK